MKKLIAVTIAVIAPLALLGTVGGYEAGQLPFWGLLLLGAGIIYAEWWGLTTMDNDD